MAQQPWQRAEIEELRRRAGEERQRARRAAALAMEYTARAADCPGRLHQVYLRSAELHRGMHERQLAAARLHETYADRLEEQAGQAWPAPPPFLAAVAQSLGVAGAAAALYSRRGLVPVLVATSDPAAEAAYNLETTFGEGPVIATATAGWPVHAAGKELPARWARYGQGAFRLGIRSVTAVPLQLPKFRLGALCCYDTRPMAAGDVAAVAVIAGVLAPILLRAAPGNSLRDLMESPGSVRDN